MTCKEGGGGREQPSSGFEDSPKAAESAGALAKGVLPGGQEWSRAPHPLGGGGFSPPRCTLIPHKPARERSTSTFLGISSPCFSGWGILGPLSSQEFSRSRAGAEPWVVKGAQTCLCSRPKSPQVKSVSGGKAGGNPGEPACSSMGGWHRLAHQHHRHHSA